MWIKDSWLFAIFLYGDGKYFPFRTTILLFFFLSYLLFFFLYFEASIACRRGSVSSFPTHEDILQKLLRDQPVRPGRALGRRTVKSTVDGVELRAELASYVEPPVADEYRLAELRAVRAEKRCLSAVNVAIMPRLASRLYVGKEAGERLIVAVEIRVGHLPQHRIIRARSTCNCNE